MDKDKINVVISSGTILKTLVFLTLAALLFYLRDIFFLILTAIVIASSIEPAVKWFGKFQVPRVLAVITVYLVFIVILGASFFLFVPPLIDELSGVTQSLPDKIELFGFGFSANKDVLADSISKIGNALFVSDLVDSAKNVISGISGGLLSAATAVFGGALSLVLILVLSFYFAVQETGIEDFLRVVTPNRHEDYIVGLWKRSQAKIGLWMQGQVLLALIVGVLAYLGLTILGVPYALLISLFAAVMELVPVFGPIISAVPAILIAFSDGGLSLSLMTLALFVIIQQFENHLIYPLVVRKVVGVPPLLVILALIIGGKLAGFLGIILSVPVAAALREYFDDIQKAKRVPANIPLP